MLAAALLVIAAAAPVSSASFSADSRAYDHVTEGWALMEVTHQVEDAAMFVYSASKGPTIVRVAVRAEEGWGGVAHFAASDDTGVRESTTGLDVSSDSREPMRLGTGVGLPADVPETVLVVVSGRDVAWMWESTDRAADLRVLATGPVHTPDLRELGLEYAGVRASPAAAHIGVGGSLTFDVERALYGYFGSAGAVPTVTTMTIQGPDGVRVCPCTFDGARGDPFGGPGRYTLSWTGAYAGENVPVVTWADVQLG